MVQTVLPLVLVHLYILHHIQKTQVNACQLSLFVDSEEPYTGARGKERQLLRH